MSENPTGTTEPTRPSGALSAMRVAELQALAGELGISGADKLRKPELVAAIRERRGTPARRSAGVSAPERPVEQPVQATGAPQLPVGDAPAAEEPSGRRRPRRAVSAPAGAPVTRERVDPTERAERADRAQALAEELRREAERVAAPAGDERGPRRDDSDHAEGSEQRSAREGRDHRDGREQRDQQGERPEPGERRSRRERERDRRERQNGGQGHNGQQGGQNRDDRQGDRQQDRQNDRQAERTERSDRQNDRNDQGFRRDDEEGGRRRGRQRNRDRKRRGRGEDYSPEVEQVSEDDVLIPVAGILEMDNNYAFLRTSGYLPGPNDVYVPMNLAKKSGLRKGDAIVGAVKAPRDDQPQQHQGKHAKFNALVRLDSVNGQDVEQARSRVDFQKLTPLYPQQRLRLETAPNVLTTRIIDLVAPIGKGQRGLIVAPAKAGKTMVMQAIANAITTNNPECHLMVVLVDERPEEVTDMQRAVRGEVISSTFDRPASDHTTVAELAIERAKRLVELGHDVVVLLDSITKLGRAYNLAAPASGRILSGGVDANALYPPKRFFGAARNIENGGSLTILATALVETGSKMDEVIFEEFKGTGNMELKLDRQLANRRIFPAVDVNSSGTRREEILMSAEELKIMWQLRRVLAALESQAGIELLLDRLKKTKSNVEFLMQVQKTMPVPGRSHEED